MTNQIDLKLIETTTMVLRRAMGMLDWAAKKTDPLPMQKLLTYGNAFDLASAGIWQVGGLVPDRDSSDARHYAIAQLAYDRFKLTAYPS